MKFYIVLLVAFCLIGTQTVNGANNGFGFPGLNLPNINLASLGSNGGGSSNIAAGNFGVGPIAGLVQNILVAVEQVVTGLLRPIRALLNQILTTVQQLVASLSAVPGQVSSALPIPNLADVPNALPATQPNSPISNALNRI